MFSGRKISSDSEVLAIADALLAIVRGYAGSERAPHVNQEPILKRLGCPVDVSTIQMDRGREVRHAVQ